MISHHDEGVLTRLSITQRHRLIGDVVSLLMASDLHKKYWIDDIGAVFFPPIHLNQFRIYKINDTPVSMVTWAYLTEDTEKKHATGTYSLKPNDWNAGDRIWMIDLLAPFGHIKPMVYDLKYRIFPNDVGKAIRVDSNGNVKKIYRFHGARARR